MRQQHQQQPLARDHTSNRRRRHGIACTRVVATAIAAAAATAVLCSSYSGLPCVAAAPAPTPPPPPPPPPLMRLSSRQFGASPPPPPPQDQGQGGLGSSSLAAGGIRQYPDPRHRQPSCTSPRTRREWRELSPQEQHDFLAAIRCLQQTPSILSPDTTRTGSVFEDFAYTHDYNTPDIHLVAQFLPWHRTMLVFMEIALSDFCSYDAGVPYWDWSIDANAPHRAPVWSDNTFGGDGAQGSDCVTTGAFATQRNVVGHPGGSCLRRRFDLGENMLGSFYGPAAISGLVVGTPYFDAFTSAVNVPHASVHNGIGDDMRTPGPSPVDPIFYLHHAMVDKVWTDWQLQNPTQALNYTGNRSQANRKAHDARDTDHFFVGNDLSHFTMWPQELMVRDAMLTDGGGWFCYRYSNSVVPVIAADPGPTTTSSSGPEPTAVETEDPSLQGLTTDRNSSSFAFSPSPQASEKSTAPGVPQELQLEFLLEHSFDIEAVRAAESRLQHLQTLAFSQQGLFVASPQLTAAAAMVSTPDATVTQWRSITDEEMAQHWEAVRRLVAAAEVAGSLAQKLNE